MAFYPARQKSGRRRIREIVHIRRFLQLTRFARLPRTPTFVANPYSCKISVNPQPG
jgi:hypothetical protein